MKVDAALFFYLIFSILFSYTTVFPREVIDINFLVVGCIATIPVIGATIQALRKKKITIDLLASVALLFSLLDRQWASVAFINLMITSARMFGNYTEGKVRKAIQSLLKLRPDNVRIKKNKDIIQIPISKVQRGDLVVVESGERIPIDGIVVEGEASINQSSLTGESMPIEKVVGAQVFSSTLNVSGSLIVRTEKIGKDTALEKIIDLVDHAQASKAPIQTVAGRFASWYILLTFISAMVLFVITKNMSIVLSVLLVTCADDIAIAIPLAFWAGIGYAANRGIIIKGGSYLEGLTQVKTLVVDKTGTITKGKIVVHDVIAFGKNKIDTVIEAALVPVVISEHPISRAIFSYGISKFFNKSVTAPHKFKEFPGKGIEAYVNKTKIIIGNVRFFEEEGVELAYDVIKQMTYYENRGFTVVLVAQGGRCIGLFALADELRDSIATSLSQLKAEGVDRIVMISGDNERVTKQIADKVGILEYHAAMMPRDKVNFVEKNIQKKRLLMMVGDGVNDAAALSQADIGIAMGGIGTDAAIESSDIVLMKDDFSKIREAITIGKYIMNVAHQNFMIWIVVNVVGLGLVFLKVIGPEGAAGYNFITDFIPLINSMRILRYQIHSKLRWGF